MSDPVDHPLGTLLTITITYTVWTYTHGHTQRAN